MNQEPNQNNSSNYFSNPTPEYTAPFIDEKPPVGKGFAVASLILGIFGVLCCCLPFVPMLAAILAVVFAIVDRVRAGNFRGLAVAGLIFGIIGVIACGYMTLAYVEAFALLGDPVYWELYMEALETGDMTALEEYLMSKGLA